jgi:hypothetical protein
MMRKGLNDISGSITAHTTGFSTRDIETSEHGSIRRQRLPVDRSDTIATSFLGETKMARRVFFSFHYQRDIWRVNQIRNVPNITGVAAAGWADASLWEEAKKKGDAVIKKMIDDALKNTSVTVVCIGYKTAGRKYINYEIEKSIERGNGIVGIKIHHLKNKDGETDPEGIVPAKLNGTNAKVYKYDNAEKLAQWVEDAATAAGK